MKYLIFLSFFLVNCTTLTGEKTQKIFICGDRECANKKEINEYFENNISIEVYTLSKASKKDYDLVELNMSKDNKNKIVSNEVKRQRFKDSLKNRVKIEKSKATKGDKFPNNKRGISKPTITLVRICKDIQECDIDVVANKIFKIGNEKKYPDLTIK